MCNNSFLLTSDHNLHATDFCFEKRRICWFIEWLLRIDSTPESLFARNICCDFQGSLIHHFNSCWRFGHQFICCKPCYNFWCIMESIARCSEYFPSVQVWPEEAMLHIPVFSTGMLYEIKKDFQTVVCYNSDATGRRKAAKSKELKKFLWFLTAATFLSGKWSSLGLSFATL